MNRHDTGMAPQPDRLESHLAGLAESATPTDFALRVLQRTGVGQDNYDTYTCLESPAGELYVAFGQQAVTGAALKAGDLTAESFEERHRSRVGRSAIRTTTSFTGVKTALRTGRAQHLPIDMTQLPDNARAILQAVRAIPAGQLRPLSWIAREASSPALASETIVGILARNPVAVLVPDHRATYEDGTPCDATHPRQVGDALRQAEGVDMSSVREWIHSEAVFLGSDTTRIFCHPTCAHARRITQAHRVPFRSARSARRAGYRACKSCQPVTA